MSSLPFHIGEEVCLSYPYVGPNSHTGQIVRVTCNSLLIHFPDEEEPIRFFRRNGQWRNEFGRAVSIQTASYEQSPAKNCHHVRSTA